MSRNYPEVLAWDGLSKLVVFVPEFYLNKATEYVNPEEGPKLLEDCKDLADAETNPERKKHLKKHENKFLAGKRTWSGEHPELNLYNALTKYSKKKKKSLAVFHGLDLVKFDPDRNPGKYSALPNNHIYPNIKHICLKVCSYVCKSTYMLYA